MEEGKALFLLLGGHLHRGALGTCGVLVPLGLQIFEDADEVFLHPGRLDVEEPRKLGGEGGAASGGKEIDVVDMLSLLESRPDIDFQRRQKTFFAPDDCIGDFPLGHITYGSIAPILLGHPDPGGKAGDQNRIGDESLDEGLGLTNPIAADSDEKLIPVLNR